MADINMYTATLNVKLTNYPGVAPVQVAFQIQLIDPCLSAVLSFATQALANIDPMELYITPTLSVTLPAFTILPTYCNPLVQLVVTEASSQVVDFISVDQQTGVLTITPINPTNLGMYSIIVSANASLYTNSATLNLFTFNLNVVLGCPIVAIVPS